MLRVTHCRVCGVQMVQQWLSNTCCHCDWHLGEGYSVEDIRKILRERIDNNEKSLVKK